MLLLGSVKQIQISLSKTVKYPLHDCEKQTSVTMTSLGKPYLKQFCLISTERVAGIVLSVGGANEKA